MKVYGESDKYLIEKTEERDRSPNTTLRQGTPFRACTSRCSAAEFKNKAIISPVFKKFHLEGKRNSKQVALPEKKEMKVVKCNTRKILLTRNRSLIPPALSLQLPPPFLKIHFSSQYQCTGTKQLENVTALNTKELTPKPRGGNQGDLEVLKYPHSPRFLHKGTKRRPKGWYPGAQMTHFSVHQAPSI